MHESEKQTAFAALKALLQPFATYMQCNVDASDQYELFTRYVMQNGKPMYFGGVRINKDMVSYHLMPLYVFPELVDGLPQALASKLKGKSCFNFKKEPVDVLDALQELTRRGYEKYRQAGYL